MKMLQNLHTHTNFCDGKNTPEEMVRYAIEKGFTSLGFSGHSYVPFDLPCAMDPQEMIEYKKEVLRLRNAYKDQLEIFLGTEYDINSTTDNSGFDYLIGACHYFEFGDDHPAIDNDAKYEKRVIDKYFGGNGMEFAKLYYKKVAEIPEHGKFDIVAHFDLVAKNCEKAELFDESSKEYRNAAFEAVEAVSAKIPFFEVNTGAIARGYRTTPYPSIPIINELKRRGMRAIITSDCHDGRFLDCHFDQAVSILRECGFEERYILTKNGFIPVAL